MVHVDTSRSRWSAVISDPQRLAALAATGLLDSPPEESFERLARLARRTLHTPVALLSLANDQRQFFKSAQGLAEPLASLREMPLSNSLCEHVVGSGAPVVIDDARRHPLGRASREVCDLHLVAYMGVPLITPERQPLGCLCVADFESRTWSADEIETLRDIAATAVHEIVLHNATTQLEHCRAEQRYRADAVRCATDDRLQLVLRAMRAGVWEWDVASGREVWSPEIYSLVGCDEAAGPLSAAEVMTRLVHPDDRSFVESVYTKLATSRETLHYLDIEHRIVRPDGTTVWISSVGSVERDESGQPIRVLSISRDISARKQAEQAQQESAQFIHKMAAVTPDMIYVFAVGEERRIYANRSLAEVLGYEGVAEEDEAALVDRVRHPEDRERGRAYRQALEDLEDHAVAELECRFRRPDGAWGWYLLRNAVFARNADGSVRQLVGTVTEITASKRAEDELRRLNAELEQRVAARTAELSLANGELESFVYSVSHDLRAPLRAINCFSGMLADHCGAQLDAEGQHYLERVHAAGKRMGELIDALLTLSRAARGQLSKQRVNMSALARGVATELARSEPDREVDIVIAEGVTATGDPALLRIALENLFGNAWKFTSRRQNARIEFGVQYGEHGPSYFVRDNGVGFDMEHAARLFAPFQRLHTPEEFPGTGIGLATVQRIIARHDGRVWAESAPGCGATFHFTLCAAGDP